MNVSSHSTLDKRKKGGYSSTTASPLSRHLNSVIVAQDASDVTCTNQDPAQRRPGTCDIWSVKSTTGDLTCSCQNCMPHISELTAL